MADFVYQTSKRAKSIRIKINSQGQVIITSPRFIPKFLINQFVKNQQNWIDKNLLKYKKIKKANTNNNHVLIFGQKYQKQILDNLDLPYGVSILNKKLIINKFKTKTKANILLDRFLKNTAQKYIIARAKILANKMRVKYKKITLRQQKTRWGSCSMKKNLNFNWRLVHFKPKVIDYVIIHELAHLKHLNHSRQFWDLVAKYDPEFKKHQGVLKRHSITLG